MNTFLVIYLSGFFIQVLNAFIYFQKLQRLNEQSGVDLLSTHPKMKSYLIMKPFFWPWFFMTEKNPIERISELFFKNYGDKGHTYYRSRGLKNFLNDVFLGKNRYKNYETKNLVWSVGKDSP